MSESQNLPRYSGAICDVRGDLSRKIQILFRIISKRAFAESSERAKKWRNSIENKRLRAIHANVNGGELSIALVGLRIRRRLIGQEFLSLFAQQIGDGPVGPKTAEVA